MVDKCKHKNTSIRKDIGWDIDETGEERQHLETCNDCGMDRLICNHSSEGIFKGEWSVPNNLEDGE